MTPLSTLLAQANPLSEDERLFLAERSPVAAATTNTATMFRRKPIPPAVFEKYQTQILDSKWHGGEGGGLGHETAGKLHFESTTTGGELGVHNHVAGDSEGVLQIALNLVQNVL